MTSIAFKEGPVGEGVEHAITNIRDEQGEMATGNVVRRACEWAAQGLCKTECLLKQVEQGKRMGNVLPEELDAMTARAVTNRICADLNLETALDGLGLETDETLMIGVTGDKVGFTDQLDEYDELTDNPYGWRELPGFNAFFAREGEVEGLGRRLADCADVNFEFKDSDGNTVFGFEHGTRPNMFGSSEYRFDGPDGTKISYTEHVMRQAIDHYGADPSTIHIDLAAAIQRTHNDDFTFKDLETMEKVVLPGWYADGFSQNLSNPDWQPGDPINPEDKWDADTRGLIIRDIEEAMATLGVPAENFDKSDIIDPADESNIYSSNKTSHRTKSPSTRDLYITYLK